MKRANCKPMLLVLMLAVTGGEALAVNDIPDPRSNNQVSGSIRGASSAPAALPPMADAQQGNPPLDGNGNNVPSSAVPPPNLTPYLAELERMRRMQRENIELGLQITQGKLRKDLQQAQGVVSDEDGSPFVEALSGVQKMRHARLIVPGYGEMLVKTGDRLPNGWRIVNISDSAVLARNNKSQRVQLPYYALPDWGAP